MKLILSHPTGNANVRAAAMGFLDAAILTEFYTTIASFPGSVLDRIGNFRPFSEVRKRSYDPTLQVFTKTQPYLEAGRMLASKAGIYSLTKHEKGLLSVDSVYRGLDKKVASRISRLGKKGLSGIYAYEDGALQSFKQAKHHQIKCFYDLPIGYWRTARKLLAYEREKWPEWSSTLTGFKDSAKKLERKDEELRLADRIFVASKFTAKSLEAFPGSLAPVEVIPYGFPPATKNREYETFNTGRPLKLIFVGGLSQRKGIANLFAAMERIGNRAELTVVGHKPSIACKALDDALSSHHWISSLSHDKILDLMKMHDVLIFPSLFEGFGLVITEAMSQGTPVITTDRTAGPDLITNGENGWLIEAGSTEAIVTAIENLLLDPDVISKVGKAAMESARQRPWDVYGRELANAVMKHSPSNL